MTKQQTVILGTTDVPGTLEAATNESLGFLIKAFRGAVRLDESENRVLLGAASATVGAWSRYQATLSAQRTTDVQLANIYARDLGGKPSDYLANAPKPVLTEGTGAAT